MRDEGRMFLFRLRQSFVFRLLVLQVLGFRRLAGFHGSNRRFGAALGAARLGGHFEEGNAATRGLDLLACAFAHFVSADMNSTLQIAIAQDFEGLFRVPKQAHLEQNSRV